MAVAASLVTDAATETRRVLHPHRDADGTVHAGDLRWSCWDTGAHIVSDLVAYASRITDQHPDRGLPFDISMRNDATVDELLRTIDVGAAFLVRAVEGATPEARGHHVFGSSDAAGFAAMGVVETLIHTYDIAQGLRVDWRPPSEQCRPVIERLFPHVPDGAPSAVLLWCAGRASLGTRPRQSPWRWDAAVGD